MLWSSCMRRLSVITSELCSPRGAAAELAQPAGRGAPQRADRHDGRANGDQGKPEAAGEQQASAGQHAEGRDERPHALREVRRIGLDEPARRQQPEAEQDGAEQEVEGHPLT